MAKDKTPEPHPYDGKSLQEIIEEHEKKLKEFIIKYQIDIETLNRILSTYEDKLEIIEKQYYDVSFKLKQLQINLIQSKESV